MKRATSLGGLRQVLKQQPLDAEELADFFVETKDARNPFASPRARLVKTLESDDDVKVLWVGHRGSGKSTELVKLIAEKRAVFLPAQLSLAREKLLANLRIEPLLVLIVETVLRALRDAGIRPDEQTLRRVYDWFSDVFHEESDDTSGAISANAGFSLEDSFFGKLLGITASLKSDIKAGAKVVNKVVTQQQRTLGELADRCGEVIREARLAIRKAQQGDLLLVVEDLDKCGIEDANRLFIDNPNLLGDLPCKAVYTAPLWVLCNPGAARLEEAFEKVVFPMIKVRDRAGHKDAMGRAAILSILDHRFDLDLLVEPDAIDLAIDKTGGVLRHLFEVLIHAEDAAVAAIESGKRQKANAKIEAIDTRYGLNQLKVDLQKRLGTVGLPKQFENVTTDNLLARVIALIEQTESVTSRDEDVVLTHAQALLEYNGEGWCRLHPLIEEYALEARKA